MPDLYPILLRLAGWRCLVLGSGREADMKAEALRECGAQVERAAEYTPGGLAGFRLVVAALDDRTENAAISAEAARHGALLNAVDDPEHCSFILPSVARRGDLTIAVSTAGACPALAVKLRKRFEAELGPEYAEFLALTRALRSRVAASVRSFAARRALWAAIVESPALEQLRQGDRAGALATLEALIAASAIE